MIRRFGVVDKIPAFQLGSPGPIPGKVKDYNFYFLNCDSSPNIIRNL